MADERDEVRARIDIVDLVGRKVPLKRVGKHWKGLCPFHPDKNPSFYVSSETGRYRCWSCGESGDIFTWVMKTQNVDFGDALRELAKEAGVSLKERGPKAPPGQRQMQQEAMAVALAFFRDQLAKNSSALEYCSSRGLDQKILRDWELGYAPDVGEALAVYLQKAGLSLSECKSLFLVDQDSGGGFFDKFRGRLMFPIRDEKGELVAFGGRLLGEGHPKYINSGDTPIYRKSRVLYGMHRARESLNKTRQAVLVEGYLDVIACSRAGVATALASLGTSATEEHAKLLKRWCDEVVVLYDSDEAGQKAALRAIEVLQQEGLRVRVSLMPPGDDPDTLLKRDGPGAVQEAVDKSLSPLDYRLQALERRVSPEQEEFWPEAVTLLAGAATHLELEKHLVRLASLYPGLRDPLQAQQALRKQVSGMRRKVRSSGPAERPRQTLEHLQLGGKLTSAEFTVFASFMTEDLRPVAWTAAGDPDLATTLEAVEMATDLASSFPEAPPLGQPNAWLHKVRSEEVRQRLADLTLDFRFQNLTERRLLDAIELLKKQRQERELTEMKQTTLDDSKRQEILDRLRVMRPDTRPKPIRDDLL